MTLSDTELLILKAIYLAGGMPTVKELSDYLPESLAKSKGISSRLCDLRKKGMTQSEMSEVGVNHWALTCDGADALLVAGTLRDTDDAPEPAVSEPIQADSVDISADIPDQRGVANCPPPVDPIAADADVVEATLEVAPDLIEEANSLRLRRPLPREHDALYVLSVLIDTLGRDSPAMAYELTRVSAYLEGEYA